MSMLPPQYPASRRSNPGLGLGSGSGSSSTASTPATTPRRRSLGGPALTTPTRRVSMASSSGASSTPAGSSSGSGSGSSPFTANTLMHTPGSMASSSSIAHRRRSLHRRTPKANEPLARIVSAASTVGLLSRTPQEISASYEQWMKLAADNKINASNSWHLGLIDFFADMRILKEGDGAINFQKASCTLDGCVKIYSTRVDAVATETDALVVGLNSAKDAAATGHLDRNGIGENDDDHDDEDSEAAKAKAAERRAKRAARKANMRTLEKDFGPITTAAIDVEFMIDPLFRKTCAEFDEGGAESLLLSRLAVGGKGQIIFDSSGIVENAGTTTPSAANDGRQEQTPAVERVDLTLFSSLTSIVNTDLTTKSMCPTLSTFVLSDEMRGVESLTQVLELDLLDELSLQMPPSSFADSLSQSQAQHKDDDIAQMDMITSQHDEDDSNDTYVPLTIAPARLASAADDFYSEANLFADEYDDDDHDAFDEAAAAGHCAAFDSAGAPATFMTLATAPATAADIGDDQFLLLPLPRSRGVLASAAAAATATPTSARLAMLRASRATGSNGMPARARKPPATIDFFTTPSLRYEDVMVKGGAGINLPRATLGGATDGGGAAMAETTSMDLHIAANPFDEGVLARSSLKPRGVFPRGLAREVKERGGVARMVEVLGGVEQEEESKVEKKEGDEDDGADVGAGADWDVEAPVLDDGEVPMPPATQVQFGEEDMDMDMDMDGGIGFVEGPGIGLAGGRVLDPIVAEDMEMRGMDSDADMLPPTFDLTIDAETLGGSAGTGFPSTLAVPRPGTGSANAGGGPQLISAFTQHMAGKTGTASSSQFRRNRMALNFAKRSKRVDVKKLKENIWRTIRRGAEVVDVVADPDAQRSDENKEVGNGSDEKSATASASDALTKVTSGSWTGELAFQDVVKQVGQQYSSDQFKDISVPFCFICVLHLANEKGLSWKQRAWQIWWSGSQAKC
ncbi:condensin complex subunit 2-domain-containing protein, partial [Catenaria anguillulae PL171]